MPNKTRSSIITWPILHLSAHVSSSCMMKTDSQTNYWQIYIQLNWNFLDLESNQLSKNNKVSNDKLARMYIHKTEPDMPFAKQQTAVNRFFFTRIANRRSHCISSTEANSFCDALRKTQNELVILLSRASPICRYRNWWLAIAKKPKAAQGSFVSGLAEKLTTLCESDAE